MSSDGDNHAGHNVAGLVHETVNRCFTVLELFAECFLNLCNIICNESHFQFLCDTSGAVGF